MVLFVVDIFEKQALEDASETIKNCETRGLVGSFFKSSSIKAKFIEVEARVTQSVVALQVRDQ